MPTLRIKDIVIGKRHRKDLGDIEGLAKSIQKSLLHPPIVTDQNELVVGFRRIKAAELLGWTEIEVRVVNPEDLLQAEHDENECRKDFTPSERVAIAESIKQRLEQSGQLATGEKARDKASQAAGFSSTTDYRRTKEVVEKGVPELVDALDKGEVSASAAATVADLPKQDQREAVKTRTVAESAKQRMKALNREKQRTKWINLIGTESKALKKKILADPDAFTDEMLLKSLPKCCEKCLRQGPPPRPCQYCEELRRPSLLEQEPEFPEDEASGPKPREHPFKKEMAAVKNLTAMMTRATKDRSPASERLNRYLSLAGLMEHKSEDRKFIACAGVVALLDAAGKEGPELTESKVKKLYEEACLGKPFIPPKTKQYRERKGCP